LFKTFGNGQPLRLALIYAFRSSMRSIRGGFIFLMLRCAMPLHASNFSS
jgi:hypothetical protein